MRGKEAKHHTTLKGLNISTTLFRVQPFQGYNVLPTADPAFHTGLFSVISFQDI